MKLKKLFSLFLAIILVLSASSTALAADISVIEDCPAGNHVFDYVSADCYPPLCTALAVCRYCTYQETVISEGDTSRLSHSDTDGDDVCDSCNRVMPYVNCGHICHSENIIVQKIIMPMLKFFWDYFDTEEFCECGTYHNASGSY